MTVTPDSGYVDYSRENIPRFQLNEESSGGARRLGPSSGVELYPHKYC